MSMLFDELSHTGFSLGESKILTNSPSPTEVSALMVDATELDEKFVMMEQTIKVLKKFVKNKDLQIAQRMNKMKAFEPRESSHFSTCPPGFAPQNKGVDESLAKSKFQKKKPSVSIATLSVQQLQDMI